MAPSKPTSPIRQIALLIAKLILAAILLFWLRASGRLDPAAFLDLHLGWPLVGVILSVFLMMILQAWRWWLLVRARGVEIGGLAILQICFIGYFFTVFLPTTGGTEAVRMLYAQRLARERRYDLLASLVLDRMAGLTGLSVLAAIFSLVMVARYPLPSIKTLSVLVFVGTVALCVLFALLVRVPSSRLPGWMRHWQPLHRVAEALHAYHGHPTVLAAALGLSLLTHLALAFGSWASFQMLNVSASPIDVLGLTPLANFAANLAPTPMGLGVTDSAASFLYELAQIDHAADMTMLSRAVLASMSLLSGIACLLPLRSPKRKRRD